MQAHEKGKLQDSPKKIRILVADDHDLVRHGILKILSGRPGWEVCGEAETGPEAVKMAQQLHPDVVIMDISMPEMDGTEATRQITQTVPNAQVLVLTIDSSEELLRKVFAAGAHGFALKSNAPSELLDAIEFLSQHRPYVTPQLAKMALENYQADGKTPIEIHPSSDNLTMREREVIQLLASGKSNKEAAAALSISAKTVETHRTHIMHKLTLSSTADLVRYAIRNQIVSA